MATSNAKRLTPLEARVMDVVWDLDEATVREVQERLEPTKPMAYNTVLTVMRILRDKGFLDSQRDGRVDVYRPTVSREEMGRHSLQEVLTRFFAGSATALVSQLIDSGAVDGKEIRAIRKKVNERLPGKWK